MPVLGGVGRDLGRRGEPDQHRTSSGSYCALLTRVGSTAGDTAITASWATASSTTPTTKAAPIAVAVVGVDGNGTLGGVASLANSTNGYCAVLTSGGVDCWGYGGTASWATASSPPHRACGSDVPVAVLGVGGSGTLGGVVSLASDRFYSRAAIALS